MLDKKYLIAQLQQPSTWRGLVMLVTGIFGFHVSPDIATSIIAAGVSVAGVIGAIIPDKIKKE